MSLWQIERYISTSYIHTLGYINNAQVLVGNCCKHLQIGRYTSAWMLLKEKATVKAIQLKPNNSLTTTKTSGQGRRSVTQAGSPADWSKSPKREPCLWFYTHFLCNNAAGIKRHGFEVSVPFNRTFDVYNNSTMHFSPFVSEYWIGEWQLLR